MKGSGEKKTCSKFECRNHAGNEILNNKAFWLNKTVLVTGATGFLGGWLVRRLLGMGCRVITVVRRHRAESQFVIERLFENTIDYAGSVSDRDLIGSIFRDNKIDVIFHTSALSDVTEALQNPQECFQSCVESTWYLLEQIRTAQPECICVVSSSDKAYGLQEMPLRESQALNPIHPYDTAKASQDLVAQTYGTTYSLPIAVTRCGNFFGGFDFSYNRLIPGTIRSAIEHNAPVLRSDGRFTRDFLYIEDAVDAQLLMAERLSEDKKLRGQAFNFSYGLEAEVLDIVQAICSLLDSDLKPIVNNNAVAETRRLTLSSDKARDWLGWSPAVGFENGLKRTIDWYVQYMAGATEEANTERRVLQSENPITQGSLSSRR